jgi:hypothetical protein
MTLILEARPFDGDSGTVVRRGTIVVRGLAPTRVRARMP